MSLTFRHSFAFLALVGAPVFLCRMPVALAQGKHTTGNRLGGYVVMHAGNSYESLAGASNSLGLEIQISRKAAWAHLQAKIRGERSSGTTAFLDGATPQTLGFRILSGEVGLGARLNILPVDKQPTFLPYFAANGLMGLASMQLPPGLAQLPSSDTSVLMGYELAAGIEILFSGSTAFFVEMQLRRKKANLAGQDAFALGGTAIVGGFSW